MDDLLRIHGEKKDTVAGGSPTSIEALRFAVHFRASEVESSDNR
jgi:hypothetical protein